MSSFQDHYAILGVSSNASEKEIRKAYLKLSLQYHPDKNPENPQEAKAQFVKIGHAYQVLSDRSERVAYDRERTMYNRYGNATSSSHSASPSSSQSYYASSSDDGDHAYDSYREAFDATMAGLSEDELRDILGAAALIGSVVGSILGSRFLAGSDSSSGKTTLLRTLGATIGSQLASHAATTLIETAHQQAVQRTIQEQDRQERVARGETVHDGATTTTTAEQAWKDVRDATLAALKRKAIAAMFSDRTG